LGKLHSACHYFFLSNIILLKSRRGKCRGRHNQLLRPSPPPRVNFPPGVVPDIQQRSEPLPAPVIIDGEPEYEISKIVDSKINHRRACKLLYKVIWLEYEDTDNDSKWLPATELEHAKELLSDFHL